MLTLNFTNQVISYSKQLNYFALHLTGNGDDAKDLLQDTMIKALIYKDKFVANTNLKAWLYTIMKNTFINEYRRTVKARSILDTNASAQTAEARQKGGPRTPTSIIAEKEIYNTIGSLSNELSTPFTMYFEGYKYKEIAEHLQLPIGTIKSRIFLARKDLMGQLKEFQR